MQFSELHETHLTDVGIICDEVLQALKDRFPGKEVDYLVGGKHNTNQGYKLSGTLSRAEMKAVQKLVAKAIEKFHKDSNSQRYQAQEFIKTWEPKVLPFAGDNPVLIGLRETILNLNKYVESHRTDNPKMAKSMAMDSDDLVTVYKLWHSGERIKAATELRHLDTIVRDYVDSKTYQAIMEHYPR